MTYLVLCGASQQGRATIKALRAKGITSIVTSTRSSPNSSKAKDLLALDGVTKVVKANLWNRESIERAIIESGATHLWFLTFFLNIPYGSKRRANEGKLGMNVIDAINNTGRIQHVVYSSMGDADKLQDSFLHFWFKANIEAYMAYQLGSVTWSVIRPAALFENVDFLSKGQVKMYSYADAPIKYVSCADIGKASAVLLTEVSTYKGKIIEAAGGNYTGDELATALSEVSGSKCSYSMTMPRPILWLWNGDMWYMIDHLETNGLSANIEDFKKIVPDAMDAKAFFLSKGEWVNGKSFESMKKL